MTKISSEREAFNKAINELRGVAHSLQSISNTLYDVGLDRIATRVADEATKTNTAISRITSYNLARIMSESKSSSAMLEDIRAICESTEKRIKNIPIKEANNG